MVSLRQTKEKLRGQGRAEREMLLQKQKQQGLA